MLLGSSRVKKLKVRPRALSGLTAGPVFKLKGSFEYTMPAFIINTFTSLYISTAGPGHFIAEDLI